MSKGNTASNDVLKMILVGTDPSYRSGSSLWISLYTTPGPGAAGNQATNETEYSNYVRMPILKTGWTDNGTSLDNTASIQFPVCGASGATITHVGIGTVGGTATGELLYFGALNSPLSVANLIQPQFSAHALTVTES